MEVIVLDDDIDSYVSDGEDSVKTISDFEAGLYQFLFDRANHQKVRSDFRTGTTIIVFGGYGRRWEIRRPFASPGWDVFAIDYSDVELLFLSGLEEFRSFMKLRRQLSWVEECGVKFYNPSGAFGHFCHWENSGYLIVPDSLAVRPGSTILLIDNSLALYRAKKKTLFDIHVSPSLDGYNVPVQRFNHDSYFKIHATLPLFASKEAALSGTLAAITETQGCEFWLISQPQTDEIDIRQKAYFIWSNFAPVFAQFCVKFAQELNFTIARPIEVYLDVTAVQEMDGVPITPEDYGVSPYAAEMQTDGAGKSIVILQPNFYLGFVKNDNLGERSLLIRLAQAVAQSIMDVSGNNTVPDVIPTVNSVLPKGGSRLLHIKSTNSPVEHLLEVQHDAPIFIKRADMQFSQVLLADRQHAGKAYFITGVDECTAHLNSRALELWRQIQKILIPINRRNLIEQLIRSNESVMADLIVWRRSALAVLSIHGRTDGLEAAFKQEQRRSQTSLASRILMEMGICECMALGGQDVGRSQLEELLALAAKIIETAYDSDAIHGGLTENRILIQPNGDTQVNHDYQTNLIHPFVSNLFSDAFDDAASSYSDDERNDSAAATPKISSTGFETRFSEAFLAEFGLSPDEFIECVADLMELAVHKNTVTVTTTIGELRQVFRKNNNLSSKAPDAFIKHFCLAARKGWETLPKGFVRKETFPWLFRRRLSVVMRPVLIEGKLDTSLAFYGLGQLKQSANYIIGNTKNGRLPQGFFTTARMRAYIGHAANLNGAAFEDETVALFKKNGWEARARVKMTELGGTPEQGDVDVLAWNATGAMFAIECKWLQPARTVGEVAEVLAKFAGEEKDRLARHLARITWLRSNPVGLRKVAGYSVQATPAISSLLVTDADVPMMYAKDLPIPTSEIVPLHRCAAYLSTLQRPENCLTNLV